MNQHDTSKFGDLLSGPCRTRAAEANKENKALSVSVNDKVATVEATAVRGRYTERSPRFLKKLEVFRRQQEADKLRPRQTKSGTIRKVSVYPPSQQQQTEIWLTDTDCVRFSPEDRERVYQYRWRLKVDTGGYRIAVAGSGKHNRDIRMHRLIAQPPDGMVVDHINGDTLDNRRENLRVCTSAENIRNAGIGRRSKTSRFKGVHLDKGLWVASAMFNYKKRIIGRFADEEEAAKAYDAFARECFGEFARLNFPEATK